jgi:Zn-dependent protease with chaperone function
MRISLQPPAPEDLQRLETLAATRPGPYRARLAFLAIAGDAVLTFVRVLPLAGPIVLGALFANNTIIYALAALAVLLLIWVVRPSYRDGGIVIGRNDAPELFATLDALKTKLDVGRRLDVRLDDDVNAGAREARGLFGIVGTRRVLTLGVPLLALLGKDEARAVIAHEFGHFSRRHGRLGHWLYWAHLGWLSHAEQIDADSSALDRAGAVFAEMFVPIFSRRAMVWSRRCEYEADADAASAVSREHIINALARLKAFDAWRDQVLPRLLHVWRRTEATAPSDSLEREMAAFEKALPDIAARIEPDDGARSAGWLDTHPGLSERAAALGVQPTLAPHGGETGSVLLGALWPTLAAEYNARWRAQNVVAWSVTHTCYQLIEAPLLAANPDTVAGWPVGQQLERARALRKYEPARGLNELAALHAAAPGDQNIAFAYAAARLVEGDGSAVEAMRALAKENASWRVPAYARLLRYHDRIGDRAGVRRWTALLESAGQNEIRAYARACDALAAGQQSPTTRPAPFVDALRAGFSADPVVAKAWLAEAAVPLVTSAKVRTVTLRADVLILVLDAFDAGQEPYDADVVRSHHQQALGDLIEPNTLPVVLSFYTTEALPPALQEALDKLPAACIYVR